MRRENEPIRVAGFLVLPLEPDNLSRQETIAPIGSRLKPGCAENQIVNAALDLMDRSAK
jgi:hypothetical protein